NFEDVLKTRIPERKIDLGMDYFVINDLAGALYARALDPSLTPDSPERREYLMRAIAAYRRTVAIDSEDVIAQYGLAQAYHNPAWGKIPQEEAGQGDAADGSANVDADAIVKLARAIADAKTSDEGRREAALRLGSGVARFMAGPRPQYES